MNEENFDLGLELANLLTRSAGNSGGAGTTRATDNAADVLSSSASGEDTFETLLKSLAPYLSNPQILRLNKALELAELLRSARQILPKISGAVGL